MAKERLSKLQKWILVETYKRENYLLKSEIYKEFFSLTHKRRVLFGGWRSAPEWREVFSDSCPVILSRSLKRLREKDLIKGFKHNRGGIMLTEKGIEKVKILERSGKCSLTLRNKI